tara:strand:+ start:3546 stop:3908 length:363 start_codon:yes stop_codon:yes gene_type:complete
MSFKLNRPKFNNKPYDIVNEGTIDGLGVVASKNFVKGEFIDTAFDNEEKVLNKPMVDTRTSFGKSINHQKDCNATQERENNKLNVYAARDIMAGEEITLNYNKAPDYVKAAVNTNGYTEK